jgi:hypothetical protein
VDRWSRGGTPSGTSEEHYRMEWARKALLNSSHGTW